MVRDRIILRHRMRNMRRRRIIHGNGIGGAVE